MLRTGWGLFPQSVYWFYLFAVSTNLNPFPPDFDAFLVKENSGSSLTQVVFLLLLALSMLVALLNRSVVERNLSNIRPVLQPMLVVAGCLFVSSVLSPHAAIAVRKFLFFAISTSTLLFLLLSCPNWRVLLRSTCGFLLVLILVSLAGVILIPDRATHSQDSIYAGAWKGITSHKNYMGGILSLALLFFMMNLSKKNVTSTCLIMLVSLYFLVMTESKTAMAGLFLSLMIAWIVSSPFFGGRNPIFLTIRYVLGVTVLLLFGSFFIFGGSMLNVLDVSSDLTGRLPLWAIVLSVMERPVLGYGYDAFFNLGSDSALYDVGGNWSRFAAHSHNGYLNIYVFGGLPALLTALFFYFRAFGLTARASLVFPRARFLVAVIIFEALRNITEVDAFTGARVTWTLTLIAAIIAQMIRAEARDTRADPPG